MAERCGVRVSGGPLCEAEAPTEPAGETHRPMLFVEINWSFRTECKMQGAKCRNCVANYIFAKLVRCRGRSLCLPVAF